MLAEYQYCVMHIPGRSNPADFLTRKRFQDSKDLAASTSYAYPDSELELFTPSVTAPAAALVHVGHTTARILTCPGFSAVASPH